MNQNKRLRRKWSQLLTAVAIVVGALTGGLIGLGMRSPPVTQAATIITVNETTDEFNNDGDCSLREAIAAANTNSEVDACPTGDPGEDIIILPDLGAAYNLGLGEFVITDSVRLEGDGIGSTAISGQGNGRIFTIIPEVTMVISGVTLQDGLVEDGFGGAIQNFGALTLVNSQVIDNLTIDATDSFPVGLSGGGGIFNVGLLELTHSQVVNNFAVDDGAGGVNLGGLGGGIFNYLDGVVILTTSIITGNLAIDNDGVSSLAAGGGIFNFGLSATLVITDNSFLDSNGAVTVITDSNGAIGGGIYNGGGTLNTFNSRIGSLNGGNMVFDNTDASVGNFQGGGIFNDIGVVNANTSMIDGNFAQDSGSGGGIFNNAGRLTLLATASSGNLAGLNGGGIYNAGGIVTLTTSQLDSGNIALVGGGIFNDGGDVILATSVISSNLAVFYGGGLFNAGTMTLSNMTVISNIAGEDGGGLENEVGGLVEVTGSTIAFNQALGSGNDGASSFGGGGIDNFNGVVTITNSTLSGNATAEHGGSLYNNTGQQTTLTNVTASFNEATLSGGGLYNDGGTTLKNTLVSNNVNGNCDPVSAVTSLGHNLDSDNTCGFTAAGDLTNIAPNLGPLQDNGGKTQTHALPDDSLAIDAGTNAGCPATDQRSVTRPVDGDGDNIAVCDIGAYEAEVVLANLLINKAASPDPAQLNQPLIYKVTITNTGPQTATNLLLTDTLPTEVTFSSVTPGSPTCIESDGIVTCDLGSLSQNLTTTVTVVVTPTIVGTIINTASAAANEPDPSLLGNMITVSTIVEQAGIPGLDNQICLPVIIKSN